MPGHDVAVKAKPRQQQESPAAGGSQVGPDQLPGGYIPGHTAVLRRNPKC